MPRSPGLLLLALAGPAVLLAPCPARAGACCAGAMSTVPTRVGECEHLVAGLGLVAETSAGRWDGDGALATSSLTDQALVAGLGLGWRWDRKGQVGLSLPLRVNRKVLAEEARLGGGAGDLRLTAAWDPFLEMPSVDGALRAPVPIVTAGLRVPTGRSWEEAEGALLEDVTGLWGPAGLVGVSVERTLDRTPWSVGVDAEVGAEGLAGARHLHPVVHGWAQVGRYLGTRWSLNGSLLHQESLGLDPAGLERASRTTAGLRLTHGRAMRYRSWASLEADLPLPGLGTDNLRMLRAGLGLALVR